MPQSIKLSKYSGRLLLILAILAICSFIWVIARVTSNSFARDDAAVASQIVAQYFYLDNTEIGEIAEGKQPSEQFKATINRGLNANVFFIYKIYDKGGVLRYSTSPEAAGPSFSTELSSHNAIAESVARSKQTHTETREHQTTAGARYLAMSIIPIIRNGETVAIQQIYIEQTQRLNQLRGRITTLALLAAILAAVAFGIPAIAWRRKSVDLAAHEAELALQTARFKTALDNLPQGIAMFDGDRNLAIANNSYAEMFGLPTQTLQPGTAADDIRKLRLEISSPVFLDFDHDGERRLVNGVETTQEMWQLRNGRTIKTFRYAVPGGGWVSLHEDVTDELHHEEELQKAQRFLNTVVENIPVAIIVKDAATLRYEFANRAVAKVHGRPLEDIIGKTCNDLFEPAQAKKINNMDRAILTINKTEAHQTEGIILTPSRGERMIATKRLAVRNPNGEAAWLITILEDVTDRRASEAKINFLAHHDPLTGLANRTRFQESIEVEPETAPGGNSFALALFDLDGFKEINDAFGHAAGDEVLRTIGNRISAQVQSCDLVARLGGDEFAVIFRSAPDEAQLDPIMDKIIQHIRLPIEFDTHKLVVEASAGIAFAKEAQSDRQLLLRHADLALYEAKSQGKGVYCAYLPEIMERRMSRKALEFDLHAAIAENQFEIHYQPIVDLGSGVIVSMEALIRWRHPERGMISPLDFIPIAEESGLIIPIGEIVLEQACKAAAKWPPLVRVSVNLSPIQFRDRNLSLKIAKVLMDTNLIPSRLELEITEAALLDDSFDNIQLLTSLRATGIRIVMDDFGTGYSSLNYLRNFPFDKIKIDRSYVRDLDDGANHSRTILSAVLAMAHGLDLSTTAEGVETQEQMDILRNAGCTEMQGFFFSRPVPQGELEAIFENNSEKRQKAKRTRSRAA